MNEFTFKDKAGTEWDLSIDLGIANAIDNSDYKLLTEVDFVFLRPEREFFAEIFSNKALAGAIAFTVIHTNQLEKLQALVTEKLDGLPNKEQLEFAFISRLNGTALRDMHRCLLKAIADFFPEMQTVLSGLLEKMDRVNSRLQSELASMDKEAEQYLNEELDKQIEETRKSIPNHFANLRGKTSTVPSG